MKLPLLLSRGQYLQELLLHGQYYTTTSHFSCSSKCRRRVSRAGAGCENQDCPAGSGQTVQGEGQETSTQYHVMVDLSDHTATLPACLLSPDAAQSMLKCPVRWLYFFFFFTTKPLHSYSVLPGVKNLNQK